MATANVTDTSDKGYYHFLFYELADKRTNQWFLISDPFPGLFIIAAYLYFVLSWGPRFMQNRKPYELKKTLIVYNFLQVIVSTYIVYMGTTKAWMDRYSWRCEPVDFSESEHAMLVATVCYQYFLAKISELLDTVFFVLRKKNNQLTFLHIYHHTVMPMISWGVVKYFPGGHGTFIGYINSFVHIIMYAYYFLSAFGPGIQKYLWWKKYLTVLQLLQFCIAFIHSMQLLFIDCGYPRWSTVFTLPNAIFFYYLFNNFYNQAYKKSARAKEQKEKELEESKMQNGSAIEESKMQNGSAIEESKEKLQNGTTKKSQ